MTALDRRAPWLLPAATIVVAVALYAFRRPDQLSHPMVWAEETVILGKWLNGQASALIDPVAGQSVLISSWLVSLAGSISVRHLPQVELILMLGVFTATLLLLILPASVWGPRWLRCLMALSLALVPINPEPYLVLLFAFWWVSFWPLIILGWRRDLYAVRIPVLVLAGISSLAASLAAPLFAVAWLLRRERRDLVSAIVLLPCLVLQIAVVETAHRQYPPLQARTIFLQVARDFTLYFRDLPLGVVPDRSTAAIEAFAALCVLALLVAILRLPRRGARVAGVALLLGVLGYAALSAIPSPLLTNPSGDGPRYYFLPYGLLGLLLLFLIGASRDLVVRVIAIAVLVIALLPLRHDYSRQADPVSWGDAVDACAASPDATYALPVQSDGRAEALWVLVVPTSICR